ncbi:MAG: radical SAM protein, partial [Candidatus Pacebacteria bacterium]|nr:radical SAM protein [Candidatus Paceibacterota bacterium]
EPTLHKDLLDFMQKVKEMGFAIKLDSNGTRPHVLREVLERKLVDYLAMDIKAPFEKYDNVTIRPTNISNIEESIEIIKNSGIDHEFRTTIVKCLLTKDDILQIGKIVEGAKRYYLQKFIPTKTNDPAFLNAETYTDEEFEELRDTIAKYVEVCGIR